MSENHISQLPVELLCLVFDQLSGSCYGTVEAVLVNRQWMEILSSKRFVEKQVLKLSEYISGGNDIDYVKHYPVVRISLTDYNSFEEMRSKLLPEELVQNVEELRICSFDPAAAKLFEGGKRIHFPNLRTLSFETMLVGFKDEIYAPNLESIRIAKGKLQYDCDLGFQFVNQVKELIVTSDDGLLFAERLFPNLQRLALDSRLDDEPEEANFRNYAHQLTHLQILDCKEILESLLYLATNLRVLDLTTACHLDYDCIGYMVNLEELSVRSTAYRDIYGPKDTIHLPTLKKAKVGSILASRLIAENLLALNLFNEALTRSEENALDRFFHGFQSRLQVYVLDSIWPACCNYFFKHIHSCTNFQFLHLETKDMGPEDLFEIFDLAEKRRFRFTYTTMIISHWMYEDFSSN